MASPHTVNHATVIQPSTPPPTVRHQTNENASSPTRPASQPGPTHSAPYLIQDHPSLTLRHRFEHYANRSPTDSIESRCNWAYKQRCILDESHRTLPPTHEAVIKFKRPVTVAEIKRFNKRCRERLRYWVKSNGHDFAIFYVIEIEPSNCVHYHLLIRTTRVHPRDVLKEIVDKASDEIAVVQHCDAVNCVEAITRYVVKDIADARTGKKEVLLFRRNLGFNFCGAWNGYFAKTKAKLWKRANLARCKSKLATLADERSDQTEEMTPEDRTTAEVSGNTVRKLRPTSHDVA